MTLTHCVSCGDKMPLVWARTFSDMEPEHICEPCRVWWREEYTALRDRKSA